MRTIVGCCFNRGMRAALQSNVKSEQMRKIFFMLPAFTTALFVALPAFAQRQSATVNAVVVANRPEETWYTAAHKSLPLGTILHTTTDAPQSRKVILKVGRTLPKDMPYMMEISQAAADSLGIGGKEAILRIEYSPAVLPRSGQVVADAYREISASRPQAAKKERVYYENEEIPAAAPPTAQEPPPTAPPAKHSPPNTTDKGKSKKELTTKQQPFAAKGTYNTRGTKVAVKGFGLQLHAFNQLNKALKAAAELEKAKLGKVYIQTNSSSPVYRVVLGEYPTKAAADKAAQMLKSKHRLNAIVKPHL